MLIILLCSLLRLKMIFCGTRKDSIGESDERQKERDVDKICV